MKFGREDYDRRIIDKDNRIPIDEPCFFLRGKDKLAPSLLLEWAKQLRLMGGDPNMARNAEDHAQRMLEWQQEHGCKTPDMFNESSERKAWKEELKSLLQKSHLEFNKIRSLVERIYGSENKLYIFTTSDLIKFSDTIDLNQIDESELKIESPDGYRDCKLALFITKEGFKVIKSDLI